jgi:hypothetical protein
MYGEPKCCRCRYAPAKPRTEALDPDREDVGAATVDSELPPEAETQNPPRDWRQPELANFLKWFTLLVPDGTEEEVVQKVKILKHILESGRPTQATLAKALSCSRSGAGQKLAAFLSKLQRFQQN